MSNHRISCRRLTLAGSFFVIFLTGPASAAIPDIESSARSATDMAPLESACGDDNSRALSSAPDNLCLSGMPSAVSGSGPWTWTCTDDHRTTRCGANVAAHYTYQTLDYPGASRTYLWGLNDLGEFTGEFRLGDTTSHAMVYHHGHFDSLDPDGLFGDRTSAAGGPNDLGTIFGAYTDVAGLQPASRSAGTRSKRSTFPAISTRTWTASTCSVR